MNEVDAVLKEAVWAMKLLQCMPPDRFAADSLARLHAFLASQVVKDWEERQKQRRGYYVDKNTHCL